MSDVLVIVGAGPGLGAAIARRFAEGGWSVGFIARRTDAVTACGTDLASFGVSTHGEVADVTDRVAVERALGSISDTLGVPNVVIYNASIFQAESALELTPEALELSLGVHVKGALNTAQAGVALMRPSDRGVVVFTVNCLAVTPEAASTAMSIGKGAQHNLALSLDLELEGTGMKVGIVTIAGAIKAGGAFDPAEIAEVYWTIANQDPHRFQRDHLFDGEG